MTGTTVCRTDTHTAGTKSSSLDMPDKVKGITWMFLTCRVSRLSALSTVTVGAHCLIRGVATVTRGIDLLVFPLFIDVMVPGGQNAGGRLPIVFMAPAGNRDTKDVSL